MSHLEERVKWNPNKPASELPEPIRKLFLEDAYLLYQELIFKKTPENPKWYQNLSVKDGLSWNFSLRALDRIRNGRDKPLQGGHYRYDAIYRKLIKKRVKEFLGSKMAKDGYSPKLRRYFR